MIKKYWPILLFILLFSLRLLSLPRLKLKDGQLVRVTGILAEEPQVSGNRQSFRMDQFQIWTERFPEYHYADKLEVMGRVKVSSNSYSLSKPEIRVISAAKTKGIMGMAIGLRLKLKEVYQKTLPQPLDGLLSGIVLGDKSLIPYQLWQILKQTGTLHIMVASGMNIALFSGTVLAFFTLFLKRKPALIFLFITIWFYSLMTGLQPPIIRAALMASLFYLSQIFGREAKAGRVLWLTGGLMLLANPLWLLDVGFQLSFLATAGLVYLRPRLKKNRFLRSENLSSSLAAQMTTLPVLVTAFGQLNLLSPLTNLAVLWTIPYLLTGGALVGILGLFWGKLAEISAYFLYPLLFYLEKSLSLFSQIKLFQLLMPEFGWWLPVVYYVFLIIFFHEAKR